MVSQNAPNRLTILVDVGPRPGTPSASARIPLLFDQASVEECLVDLAILRVRWVLPVEVLRTNGGASSLDSVSRYSLGSQHRDSVNELPGTIAWTTPSVFPMQPSFCMGQLLPRELGRPHHRDPLP
jgi:hypothetical protein